MNQSTNNLTATQAIAPYPNPPEYAQFYTNERLAQGDVPQPPPPFTEFRVFGEEYKLDDDVIRPLESAGIRQLYPAKYDWKEEMKKLNRSVIAAFLDLLDILIRCPDHSEREVKLTDIHTLFINMHHLINEYRPVQARDLIRLMQVDQIKELEEAVELFKTYMDDGRKALKEVMKVDTSRLTQPPKPKPSTLVTIDSDEEETSMPRTKPAQEDVEMLDDDSPASSVGQTHRRGAKPSLELAKHRHAIDLEFFNQL
ncbi:hypothetical protein WR25_20594 [Diploscapter pachys]|uniref:Mediator of RNA polymerase II transcription subunit 7 n=1 Tax=Diploscapter pachys TaxID=2018661 RepID=A0A2A2K5G6_9BILA|nr:hypothetical protein WR25_20594 [Diploscapter pachys]